MHRAPVIAITCLLLLASAMAARYLAVIEEPQPAQRVEGVVVTPMGDPIPDMTVTDCTKQWASVLRTTTTDLNGRFRFPRQADKTLYYLRFDNPGFNPLQLKLKLDKKAPERAITVKPPIGG